MSVYITEQIMIIVSQTSLRRVRAFSVHDAFGTWGCTTLVHCDFGTYDDYFGT